MQGEQRTALKWPEEKDRWQQGDGILWIDMVAPAQAELEDLAAVLGLSGSVVRACLNPEHRARLKEQKNHLLLVLNAVGRGSSDNGELSDLSRWRTMELNVVAGPRFVLTVHPHTIGAVTLLFGRWSKDGEGRPHVGYLLHAIAETITLGYYAVLDRIDLKVEEVESEIISGRPTPRVTNRLFTLKKHILYLRRVLGPQRDALGSLVRREIPYVGPDMRPYLLEDYEQTLRIFDLLDTYRDLISSSLDAYLSTVSNRMNEIMKTLTIVSTIMLPLTLISGVFGMNFVHMPMTEATWGFAAVTALMVGLGAAMTYYFKHRGWF